jgi:hypothetical protein
MWSPEIFGNNNTSTIVAQSEDMVSREGDKSQRGRPRLARNKIRSCRIVTFVTKTELEKLKQIALDDDRSLSAAVHRIISKYVEGAAK